MSGNIRELKVVNSKYMCSINRNFIIKATKIIGFWCAFVILNFISKRIRIEQEFRFVCATVFVAIIVQLVISDRYKNLIIKRNILRAMCDIITYVRDGKHNIGGMQPIFNEMPVMHYAKSNIHLFSDYRIVEIIFDLDKAVKDNNPRLIREKCIDYVKANLEIIRSKVKISNFLIYEILQPIFIQLPMDMIDAVSNFAKRANQ